MADYKVLITNNGILKLEEAMAAKDKLVITDMGFGDAFGEPYIPSVTQTDLKNLVFKKPVVEATVSEGVVRYKSTLLSTDPEGNFVELGMYLEDGTLFAVANIPRIEHRHSDSGSVTETDVTMVLAAENAENITISVASNIYVSKDYANSYYLRTDGENSIKKDISWNNNKIVSLKSGTAALDATNVSQLLPIGTVFLWAGVNAPSNAKDCDGNSYSRVGAMSELYKVIGTLYGKGDGSLTFNVPKLSPPDPSFSTLRYMIKYKN